MRIENHWISFSIEEREYACLWTDGGEYEFSASASAFYWILYSLLAMRKHCIYDVLRDPLEKVLEKGRSHMYFPQLSCLVHSPIIYNYIDKTH
jgi:hypothetical protein